MFNRILITLLLSTFLSTTALAKEASHGVVATVHGMVCEFCAVGLEKQFKKREEVKLVEVSLEEGTVRLEYNGDESLSDEQITTIITDNGIHVESIQPWSDSEPGAVTESQ